MNRHTLWAFERRNCQYIKTRACLFFGGSGGGPILYNLNYYKASDFYRLLGLGGKNPVNCRFNVRLYLLLIHGKGKVLLTINSFMLNNYTVVSLVKRWENETIAVKFG